MKFTSPLHSYCHIKKRYVKNKNKMKVKLQIAFLTMSDKHETTELDRVIYVCCF